MTMNSILRSLYEDGLEPSARPKHYIAERAALKEKHFKLHDELFETLSEKQKVQFSSFLDQIFEDLCYADYESFIDGFRLGARIIIEVFTLPSGEI